MLLTLPWSPSPPKDRHAGGAHHLVRGPLPFLDTTVLRVRQPWPWMVQSRTAHTAVLTDLAGEGIDVALTYLHPDEVDSPPTPARAHRTPTAPRSTAPPTTAPTPRYRGPCAARAETSHVRAS